MRGCLDCRGLTHLACLEQIGEAAVRYRCRKCRLAREKAGSAQAAHGEKGLEERAAGKRL